MRRRLLAVALVVAAAGCKKRPDPGRDVMPRMREFRDQMCACKDAACAQKISDAMTAWSMELAKDQPPARPDDSMLAEMQKLGADLGMCMQKAMGGAPPVVQEIKVSSPADHPSIAQLLREARTHAHADDADLELHQLGIGYVRSDGTLDPKYGAFTAGFGLPDPDAQRPAIVDDPNRPTGAPIPEPPPAPPKRKARDLCPTSTWSTNGWTWENQTMCYPYGSEPALAPRCTAAEVWKRALAANAPADALAVLRLSDGPQGVMWTFTITDRVRDVHVDLRIPDDCDPVVEK